MSANCPSCGEAEFTLLQRFATRVTAPRRCPVCGSLVAVKLNPAVRGLFALAETVIVFAAMVSIFAFGSWWPALLGGIVACVLIPATMVAVSPLVVVTPSEVKAARKRQRLALVAFLVVMVLLVVLAGG